MTRHKKGSARAVETTASCATQTDARRVLVAYPHGQYYAGSVYATYPDGSCDVRFDDGECRLVPASDLCDGAALGGEVALPTLRQQLRAAADDVRALKDEVRTLKRARERDNAAFRDAAEGLADVPHSDVTHDAGTFARRLRRRTEDLAGFQEYLQDKCETAWRAVQEIGCLRQQCASAAQRAGEAFSVARAWSSYFRGARC